MREIADAGNLYRVSGHDDLSVWLAVDYLVFNEGYLVNSGEAPIRKELGPRVRRGDVGSAMLALLNLRRRWQQSKSPSPSRDGSPLRSTPSD